MTWLAWRQSRASWLATAGILAIYLGLALWERLRFPSFNGITASVSVYLALFLGLVVGAPMVGRELEQGTYRFIWGQSISRRRWLTARVAVALTQVVLAVAVLHTIVNWVAGHGPVARGGALASPYFLGHGLIPYALAAFAVAVGIAAGAVTRRTLPAVGAALVAYVAGVALADASRARLAHAWGDGEFWSVQLAVGGALLVLAGLLMAIAYRMVERRLG